MCNGRGALAELVTGQGALAELYWPSCTVHEKRAITWATEVRIEKFKSLTSSSLMWLQFTRRTHCQIPFISYPKINSMVWLMRVIKNREIFLVQLATRPFPKHIYRSLIALLNSTLTRNKFESFQTQPIHKIEGSKPRIYTFYTNTRQIPYSNSYKALYFHTRIHTQFVASIPVIFFFLSFFLLFFSLLLLLLPFSSLLSYPFFLSLSPRPK